MIVLIACTAVTILLTVDTSTIFAAAPPSQIYEPTMPDATQRVVCIAFDDGWKSHLTAASILRDYNYNATYPIIASYIGYPAYLDWSDIASLAQGGNDIVSHTNTHLNLSAVGSQTLNSELAASRAALRSKGYAADVLIYPYGEGEGNATVRSAVAENYLVAVGTESGSCNLTSFDRYNVNSVVVYRDTSMTQFAASLNGTGGSTVTILYYHKVSDENVDNAVGLAAFRSQMQYLTDNGFIVRTISQQFLKQTP